MRRLLALIALLAACRDVPTAPPSPSALQVTSGDGQRGVPGYRLASPVGVTLLDETGHPVAGDTVTFTPDDETSETEPGFVVTDAAGRAQTYWRIGAHLGVQSLIARVESAPASNAATIRATAASNLLISVDGGYFGLCGVDVQGRLGCWMPPRRNQPDPNSHFDPVPSSERFTQVTIPINGFGPVQGCALAQSGRVWCFGVDSMGAVHDLAELAGAYPALAQITSSDQIVDYCGLTAIGEAWCWGANDNGQLGDGTSAPHSSPAAVQTSARFVQMDMDAHACGVTTTGEAWCWGSNREDAIGPQDLGDPVLRPVQINTPIRFRSIRVDDYSRASCAFAVGGGEYCWGSTWILQAVRSPGAFPPPPNPVPTLVNASPQGVDMATNAGMNFVLTRGGRIEASGDIYVATEGGEGAPLRVPTYNDNLLRNIMISHGWDYLCGTSSAAMATICPSTEGLLVRYHASASLRTMPHVVGVPVP